MAGRRGSCGVRNHGRKEDNKLSGMSDGSRIHSENPGEGASLLTMQGSGDRNNRSDGEDEKILEMGGPRNRNEMEVEQLDEKEQIKKHIEDQSRSYFAMVLRIFRRGGKWSRWYAEVKRPVGFMGGKSFTCGEYDTDVEAAVAASVAARVFQRKAECMRSNPPFKCHDYLIRVSHGSRLPYSFENKDIKEFVRPCVKLFVKIAKDVENKIQPMPQDPGMAKAIKCYREAVRYDHEYEEGKVPPLKQASRG